MSVAETSSDRGYRVRNQESVRKYEISEWP